MYRDSRRRRLPSLPVPGYSLRRTPRALARVHRDSRAHCGERDVRAQRRVQLCAEHGTQHGMHSAGAGRSSREASGGQCVPFRAGGRGGPSAIHTSWAVCQASSSRHHLTRLPRLPSREVGRARGGRPRGTRTRSVRCPLVMRCWSCSRLVCACVRVVELSSCVLLCARDATRRETPRTHR